MSDTESEPVPLVDLRAQFRTLGPEMEPALRSVMERGAFIGGTEIGDFEERFANWCGAAHAVGTSSGTTAWHLLLVANEIGPGDEVIIPSHTFIATVEAIWHAGATPVFAEIDPATFCMHPIAAEAMVTPRTKAICPVHLYGRLADMAGFRELCDRCGLLLFEDAAQAHGAIPTTSAQGRAFFPTAAAQVR